MIELLREPPVDHDGLAELADEHVLRLEIAVDDLARVRVCERLGHRDDVGDLLSAADVFALPSLYEGTAGAAIEALALETPIVATDLMGTRGVLVNGQTARLVPVGDPATLARAVAATLDDDAARDAQVTRGRALFDERFTLSRSAEQMASLYVDLATAGRGRRGAAGSAG